MDNSQRITYWEKYTEYWNDKVNEANSVNKEKTDKAPSDNVADQFFDILNVSSNEKLLDFGCGFCRIYPHVKEKNVKYFGVDIARSPLDLAISIYPELEGCLQTTKEDIIPFTDNSFDKLFCFGVFDACYQEKSILEIIRVLNINGQALITGKNTNYHADDENAFVAEVNARKKGHPNYFTDFNNLYKQLVNKGVEIKEIRYFERRGDMTNNSDKEEQPDFFYEFLMIIQKKESTKITEFEKFSDEYSNTYKGKEY